MSMIDDEHNPIYDDLVFEAVPEGFTLYASPEPPPRLEPQEDDGHAD